MEKVVAMKNLLLSLIVMCFGLAVVGCQRPSQETPKTPPAVTNPTPGVTNPEPPKKEPTAEPRKPEPPKDNAGSKEESKK